MMAGNFDPSAIGSGHSFQARVPGGVTNYYTLSATGMCGPSSEPYLLPPPQSPILIGDHHHTQLPPQALFGQRERAPWPRPMEPHHGPDVDLTGHDSSPEPGNTQGEESTISESATVFLKIFNPQNKKQVINMRTLRDFPCNLGTVDNLREELFYVCGESELPRNLKFDVGYFNKNKKLWINCSQDLCDAWSIVRKGGRLTFWCVGVGSESDDAQKRGASTSNASTSHPSKKRKISMDDKLLRSKLN